MLLHIGKCAGGSIQIYLKKLSINSQVIHLRMGDPKLDIELIKKSNYIFIPIRDPIKRYTSIFYFYKMKYDEKIKIGQKEEKSWNILNKVFERFQDNNELAEALNSDNIEDKNLALSFFSNCHHHITSFKQYITDEVLEIIKNKKIFIIRTEKLNDDFKKICSYFKKDFEIIKNNKIEIHNTNKYKNDKKKLSEKSIINLKKQLQSDYNTLYKLYINKITDELYI